MTFRKQLAITTALLALTPFAAQAAAISWVGTTSNAWETGTDWSTLVAPVTTSAVTIAVPLNSTPTTGGPVQINSAVVLSGAGGALNIGAGAGTTETLNINAGKSLTMGTKTITLNGGSITGTGTISTTGAISGFGTISAPITTAATYNANGTAGNALTLTGGNTITGGALNTTSIQGGFNLNNITLSGVTTGGAGGTFNLTGNSTLTGSIARNNTDTFNTNANTLSLKTATISGVSGGNVFNIGVGGILDNASGNSSVGNDGNTNLAGGKVTNSGGTFTFNDQISGFGTVQGPVTIGGSAEAIGGTLTLDGTTGAITATGVTLLTDGKAGSVLDLKGSINFGGGGFLYPNPSAGTGSGVVQLDGATLNGTINAGKGTVNVVNSNTTLKGTFNPNGVNGVSSDVTVKNGAGLTLANTSGSTAMWSNNFTMENKSTLVVGAANNAIQLSAGFFFQQTDAKNAWTHGSTTGLGPDLIMTGGSVATPVTMEVGGVNMGNAAGGYVNNFALDSLALGTGAYVDLVDQNVNATPSGWVSGVEALYVDGLIGVLPGGKNVIPTLNLGGLYAFDLTCPAGEAECSTHLLNGLYTDANGGEINIIGAPVPTPEPATLLLFGTGLAGLGLIRRRRT